MSHHTVQGKDGHGWCSCLYRSVCLPPDMHSTQLDAGMHPALDGIAALPWFDEFDLGTVDILLISQ